MTERRRHSPDKKSGRAAKRDAAQPRRRKDEVSLADRLAELPPQGSASATVLPAGSSLSPVQPQTRKQLRAQREQQQHQAKQRWIITAAAVLGVVVLGVILALWLAGRGDDTAAPGEVGRTERTLTMTLAAEGNAATSGALMVNDADNETAGSVLIQSRLFVEGPTPGGLPFGETVLLGEDGAPGTALADTLKVAVDGTWQMSDQMLADLVDASDGVLVDVDTDVLTGPARGQQSIVVPAGDAQLLNGEQAVAFATYLGPDENEESRLARFGQVLDQVTQRLPEDRAELLTTLEDVNATENSTLSNESLADFLLGYGAVADGGGASYQSLPVDTLETGGPEPSLIVEPAGLERLRAGLLVDSLPPDSGGEQITVLVQNGVGTPGLEQDAAVRLRDQGYDFFNGGNAREFGREQTLVLIPDASEASRSLAEDVATTLGVPASAVQINDQGSSLADVIVILGSDFKP
ncbi:MAG: LCP family protein [Actinomycetia bacterium]|nr:LCP family protein [Actinomycetes bacterium]